MKFCHAILQLIKVSIRSILLCGMCIGEWATCVFVLCKDVIGQGGIVVHAHRVHASSVEGLQFKSDSISYLNACSLLTQKQIGTW